MSDEEKGKCPYHGAFEVKINQMCKKQVDRDVEIHDHIYPAISRRAKTSHLLAIASLIIVAVGGIMQYFTGEIRSALIEVKTDFKVIRQDINDIKISQAEEKVKTRLLEQKIENAIE